MPASDTAALDCYMHAGAAAGISNSSVPVATGGSTSVSSFISGPTASAVMSQLSQVCPHHISLSKAGQHLSACLPCKVAHSMYITYHCNTCRHYIVTITSDGTPKTLSLMSLRIHCNIAAGILYVVQVTMRAASVAAASALAVSCSQHVQTVQLDCDAVAQTVCC